MKCLLILLSILLPFGTHSQTITSAIAEIFDENVVVYAEPAGINKIGQLRGKDFVFIIDKGDHSSFKIYRKGVVGYVSKSRLNFRGKEPVFNSNDSDNRLKVAKQEEVNYEKYLLEKNQKERLAELTSNIKFTKAGFSISNPQYIDGSFYSGFKFSIANYSKKTIKYVYLTVIAYNPVNDVVDTKKFSFVGPIETSNAEEYKNDFAFNSRSVAYYRIKKVEIQYKDGTKKEVIGETLKDATVFLD